MAIRTHHHWPTAEDNQYAKTLCRDPLRCSSAGLAAPLSVSTQLDQITRKLYESIADNMIGVYLHGSLAMGCFNPALSDIDLLVLTAAPLTEAQRRAVLTTLLALSGAPHPVEISFLHYAQMTPWRHPAPYDLHFSEMHRNYYTQILEDSAAMPPTTGVDIDLAAHFTVLAMRGVCLQGAPIAALPIAVPWDDYVDSLRSDFEWSAARRHSQACLCAAQCLSHSRRGQRTTGALQSRGWALGADADTATLSRANSASHDNLRCKYSRNKPGTGSRCSGRIVGMGSAPPGVVSTKKMPATA